MCGITGIFYSKTTLRPQQDLQSTLDAMTNAIVHRGPDSKGTWIDNVNGIGLGHQRLAIRDLSPTGHQPMISSCGRYIIVYNGEVYSHQEIAKDLQKCNRYLKGTSDTEVILEACAEWGVETTVKRLIGMFSFALYDKKEHALYLVRDRLGIKPLYYGFFNGLLIFGSELKALRANPNWQPQLNRNALAAFLRYKYVPAPESIYQHICKLQPGCIFKINLKGETSLTPFWNLRSITESKTPMDSSLSENELIDQLHLLLADAVKRRLVSDVPIGSLLSGGIDSSLVTALMAAQSEQSINTFSIGFDNVKYNEAPFAKEVANHLGTHHTELYVSSSDALSLLEKLPYWYDEPFADHSQIPTMLLCEMAKKHATVVLSGDGGDELFAGYQHYQETLKKWNQIQCMPYPIRILFAKALLASPSTQLNKIGKLLGTRLHHFANRLQVKKPDELYRLQSSTWYHPETIIKNAHESKGIDEDPSLIDSIPSFMDRMMLIDTLTYLPDDILTKVDRASMRVALEVRIPLIDHRVVEFATHLPEHMKLQNGQAKWILKQILYKYVPQHLVERPKKGFGMPLEVWLRGPLRDWAEHLLSKQKLQSQNLWTHQLVHERWKAFLAGSPCGSSLWSILMAQAWIEANPEVSL